MTSSHNGGFGANLQLNTPAATPTPAPQPLRTPVKVCSCGETVTEAQANCPRCFNLTESALPILLG